MREKQYPQPSTALTGPRPDPGLQGLLQAWAGKHAATAPRRLGSLQNSYKILIIGDAAPTARRIGLLTSASCARLISSQAAAVNTARASRLVRDAAVVLLPEASHVALRRDPLSVSDDIIGVLVAQGGRRLALKQPRAAHHTQDLLIYENAEVLGVEVKTCSGGHVRFMSKAELQRYGDVVFVHYDWTSARRGQGYRRGHGSGART